jgi:hypothetical protein
MILYDRIYYTLYRMTIRLDDLFEAERETPRAEVVLILSFFTGVNFITVFGLLGFFIGKPVFPEKKIYMMVMLLPIVALNFQAIFYKKRYRKIEEKLLPAWKHEKRKNILITILYIIFSVLFFCGSIAYFKNHAST